MCTNIEKKITSILKKKKVLEAYLFGSCADKSNDEYSDLDICIITESKRTFFERFKDFPELYELGYPIDLLIYLPEEKERMLKNGNAFLENIIEHGVCLIKSRTPE